MAMYVCFESGYVGRTLRKAKKNDLVIFDSDGIDQRVITDAKKRQVHLYDYLNVGSIEPSRKYYDEFKDLRIAKYSGWNEFWIDVTDIRWQNKLIELAKEKKKKGAIGLYMDNGDILWQCIEGFKENKTKMIKSIPDPEKVFFALKYVVEKIATEVGLIIMPNGADVFVRQMFYRGWGCYIKTVIQEGVLYSNFKKQNRYETAYLVEYLNWCLDNGLYVRGIEYVKSASGIKEVKRFYSDHGYKGLYISKHKTLKGD